MSPRRASLCHAPRTAYQCWREPDSTQPGVSAQVPACAATACSRAVGKEDIPWKLQRGCRRLLAATGRQQKIGSSTRAGSGQGQIWVCCFCFELPSSLGPQNGSCGKVCRVTGHPGSYTLELSKMLHSTDTAARVCAPQLTAGRQPWALSVCPGQLMAPCSVEIILPFVFQPPALCNNQMLGVVLKSQYFSVKGFMMTFKVRQPSLFSLKAALIQLVSKPSWNLQQLVVKKIKTITAIVKKLERLFLFISHYFYGCPRLPVSPHQGCSHRFFFFFPKLPSCEELGEGSKSSTSYHSSLPNDFSKRLMTRASSRALEHAECTVLPGTLLAGASCCCARRIPGRAGESHVPARPPAHSCSAWAQ